LVATKIDEPKKPRHARRLIARFRFSEEFVLDRTCTRTRAGLQKCFDYLYPIGTRGWPRFTRPLVVKDRDKAARRVAAVFG